MPSFADWPEHHDLLEISRRHREAVDNSRIYDGRIVGRDNYDNLLVSTIFAAIAIEAAVNDYLMAHLLYIDSSHLRKFFGDAMTDLMRVSIHRKLQLLTKFSGCNIPQDLCSEVRRFCTF